MPKLHVALFMTWDVSMALWQEKGMLDREIKLYQALAKKGVRITFFSWGGAEEHDIVKSLAPDITVFSAYDRIYRPKNKALRALCSLLLPWAFREELQDVDIFKTNQMWGGWVALLAKLFSRKPLVVRCGFELYDFTCKQKHSALRRKFIWLISRMTYGLADRICVATPQDKDFVVKTFKQDEDKISVHPNWIDTDRFAPLDIPQKENHILFVGRITEQKNIPLLIEAIQDTDLTLDIVGEGELKQEMQRLGSNVNFLGSYSNDALPELYNSYPVFVLPSHYEGNPKTLLEAMACGCAVIGTDVPGISSVIEHETSGLICASDAPALKKALVRLMNDRNLRECLGQHARKQIKATQTLIKLVDMEIECYAHLTGRAHA